MSTSRISLLSTSVPVTLIFAKGSDGVTYTVRIEHPFGVYESQLTQGQLLFIASEATRIANS